MGNSFFSYIEQLELMIFFSGYPLMYILIRSLSDSGKLKKYFKAYFNTVSLLPLAYAFTGVLYLGLQLKELYPDYSVEHIRLVTEQPFLKIWGLLSIAFFLPALSRRPVLSLLHSLVFFFFLLRDLYSYTFINADNMTVKNDMRIYTYSLLLNLAAFIFTVILYSFIKRVKSRKTQ